MSECLWTWGTAVNLDVGLAAFGNEAAVYFERQHASQSHPTPALA